MSGAGRVEIHIKWGGLPTAATIVLDWLHPAQCTWPLWRYLASFFIQFQIRFIFNSTLETKAKTSSPPAKTKLVPSEADPTPPDVA